METPSSHGEQAVCNGGRDWGEAAARQEMPRVAGNQFQKLWTPWFWTSASRPVRE